MTPFTDEKKFSARSPTNVALVVVPTLYEFPLKVAVPRTIPSFLVLVAKVALPPTVPEFLVPAAKVAFPVVVALLYEVPLNIALTRVPRFTEELLNVAFVTVPPTALVDELLNVPVVTAPWFVEVALKIAVPRTPEGLLYEPLKNLAVPVKVGEATLFVLLKVLP
jgi:ABC-type proline/glycine betaine transport system permease subunit